MQTQTKVLIILGLFVLIVIGFSMTGEKDAPNAVTNSESTTVDKVAESEMDNKENAMNAHPDTETDVVMADDKMESDEMNDGMSKPEPAPLVAGVYTEYTPEAVANSEAKHIILNFSATWCPSCRTLDKNINENVSEIPDGVEIYKVDYDTNVDLRKKYGIATQHTIVVVDNEGNMIKKWTGGNTLSGLVSQL